MKVLKLLKGYNNLNASEIAGFPDDEAKEMIRQGVGKLYKPRNKVMSKPRADKMVRQSENKNYTREELEDKFKKDLKEIAKDKDIPYSRKSKEELIEDILEG